MVRSAYCSVIDYYHINIVSTYDKNIDIIMNWVSCDVLHLALIISGFLFFKITYFIDILDIVDIYIWCIDILYLKIMYFDRYSV